MAITRGPKIVRDGLVLYLDAGDRNSYPGSGTTWKDLSGNGNNGTLTNGPTFDSGNGGSIVFDGSDDYVDIGKSILRNLQSFTVNICFSANSTGALISEGASSNRGFQFWIDSTESVLQFGDATNDSYFNSRIPTSFNNILDVSFSTQNKTGISYVNSVYQDSWTNNDLIDWTSYTFKIATRETANSSFVNCKIYMVKVYNRALSDVEIQQNFNATKGRFNL